MPTDKLNGTSNLPLVEADPELFGMIVDEAKRQYYGLEMIASENFTSRAVIDCLGSILTNKYSEGVIGRRYYGGTEHIDRIESLCHRRILAAYNLDPEEWGVNVQPYSGSTANWCVYVGLLNPHDRLMGLDLPSGGHLTHGFYTPKLKVSATSVFFESLPYRVRESDGLIDFENLENLADLFRPKILVTGHSAYPRVMEWERFRAVADKVGCMMMADIAHISGLVATGVHPSPFPYCDVVTSTTHKSLRGPRSGLIFYRLKHRDGTPTGYKAKIDSAVFPSVQGGPHNHQIAAVATQALEVATPEFKQYSVDVVANSKALCAAMIKRGFTLPTGGSDNHLILWNVRVLGVPATRVERLLEHVGISVNRNTLAGDQSALHPGGIRIGVGALTTRGLNEADMEAIADFFEKAVALTKKVAATVDSKLLAPFSKALEGNADVVALEAEVAAYAGKLPFPGLTPDVAKAMGVSV